MKYLDIETKNYIADACNDLGFKDFSAVQRDVFDKFYNNDNNILVKSKTGSGKTHAFLIPIFNELKEEKKGCFAVILSPTKELASQTYKVCKQMASFYEGQIDIKLYSGGTDRLKEIEKIKNSTTAQIVIGTPGRIFDLAIKENALKIFTAKYVVIDEVDMCMDMGFKEELDQVMYPLNEARMMFFSATIREEILPFLKKYLGTNDYINIQDTSSLNIQHIWIPLKHRNRYDMLIKLMHEINPYLCLIFCNTKMGAIELADQLRTEGYKVGEIHGDLSARERKRVMADAASLRFQYIVCTDLAARGIDIDGVSHVINYLMPRDFEFYLHRSGRTGRMNYSGICYSFYGLLDEEYLNNLNAKGIKPAYQDIKENGLVEYKGRNSRSERVKPTNEFDRKAAKAIRKPNGVKPGYKKKLKNQRDQYSQQLKKAANPKKKYYK